MKKLSIILPLLFIALCSFAPKPEITEIIRTEEAVSGTMIFISYHRDLNRKEIAHIRSDYFQRFYLLSMAPNQPSDIYEEVWIFNPGRPGGDCDLEELEKQLEEENRLEH